jgi:hypothetical protein
VVRVPNVFVCSFGALVCALVMSQPAAAAEWFVSAGSTGDGSAASPFGRIQDAVQLAQPGDIVTVAAGTYRETLRTVRGGTATQRIVIRKAAGAGAVLVTSVGRVFTFSHPYVTLDGLSLDGQFGADDLVRIGSGANATVLRNCDIGRTSKDAIDIGAPQDVLIEGCKIHEALNATNGRTDAHGVVAGAVRRLTVRNTEIHTFSGDGLQVDPGRDTPGWDDVTIEGCRIWLAPLATPLNGFAAGVVPGENAVDTKVNSSLSRAHITIRDTEAFGFRGGLISNMAAFNLKENIDAIVDRVTVHDSEIGFRLRGGGAASWGAWVRVQNAVVHSSSVAFRYEDNIQNLRIWNATVGSSVPRAFVNASANAANLDVRNFLLLGTTLPVEARNASSLAVGADSFVSAGSHNYQLAAGSKAVDGGVAISDVSTDRQGTKRPQGAGYDIGAFERAASASAPEALDVVLYAWKAPTIAGNWSVISDATAAGGALIASTNNGVSFSSPQANPSDYFELTFAAEAGRPYRMWLRGRAKNDRGSNDAVYVQFSDSIDAAGTAILRVGSSSAAAVELKECSTCPLSGWGWQDSGETLDVLGPVIYFAATGEHTMRIQIRQDGLSIDQIVLSASSYLTARPGAAADDTTILTETGS